MSVQPDDFDWWWGGWKDLFTCGNCWGFIGKTSVCPVCATDYRNPAPLEMMIDGKLHVMPQAFAGALGWSHYVMLQLMHREWLRPLLDEVDPSSVPPGHKPSPRVLVVLLFWTFFETMMGRFYETATAGLPGPVGADLLKRYNSIGSRLTVCTVSSSPQPTPRTLTSSAMGRFANIWRMCRNSGMLLCTATQRRSAMRLSRRP